jgi:hypothetical protein
MQVRASKFTPKNFYFIGVWCLSQKSICSKFTLSISKLCRFTVTNYISPYLFNINQMVASGSKAPQQNAPALHANI